MNRVMIVVTHLLGSGHLARALLLGLAFRDAGHAVVLVSGGKPVTHLRFEGLPVVQLPPLASNGTDFRTLLTPGGAVATEDYHARRRAILLDTLAQFRPDCLITELFPFGRRALRGEFSELLAAARAMVPRPCILASIRDILAPPSTSEKAAAADAIIAAQYDGVLVHSDPDRTPLSASWPVSALLQRRLFYTGYIAPPAPEPAPDLPGAGEILVSAGGGDVGTALYEAAIGAAALRENRRWRLLIGGGRATTEIPRLRALAANMLGDSARGAAARIAIEPARPDFRAMLCHAAASVSLCGYNTALDLLAAGTPGVFVPFDAGGEVEQGIRARSLSRNPHFAVLAAADLEPTTLLGALDAVLAAGRFVPDRRDLDGAARSVALAGSLCHAH